MSRMIGDRREGRPAKRLPFATNSALKVQSASADRVDPERGLAPWPLVQAAFRSKTHYL